MFIPTFRLEAAGLDPFVFDTGGVGIIAWDLGDADTRVVAEDAPDADGTIDSTEFTGARSIAVQLHLDNTTWATRQHLRAFTNARRRPTLIFQIAEDAPVQQATLRRGHYSDPLDIDYVLAGQADVTIQWVAPLGILESNVLHTFTAYAAGDGTIAGRTYPLTFPRTYPAMAPLGEVTVYNAGGAYAYPIIRLYGPATDPVIDNLTEDRSIAFAGLTIPAGEYLELDLRAHTVLMNGDPADSRYAALDFAVSDWWTLAPGVNEIRYHPATSTQALTVAVGTYRDAYE